MNERIKVWKAILAQNESFTIAELFCKLEKQYSLTDKELILQVLDQMYDEGLLSHGLAKVKVKKKSGFSEQIVVVFRNVP